MKQPRSGCCLRVLGEGTVPAHTVVCACLVVLSVWLSVVRLFRKCVQMPKYPSPSSKFARSRQHDVLWQCSGGVTDVLEHSCSARGTVSSRRARLADRGRAPPFIRRGGAGRHRHGRARARGDTTTPCRWRGAGPCRAREHDARRGGACARLRQSLRGRLRL